MATPNKISESLPPPDGAAATPPAWDEDDPLLPFDQLVSHLADYDKQLVDPATGQALTVEQLQVDMPIELRVTVEDDGSVSLNGAPPTQRTETTILPVFHQMKLRIVREDYS
ncbi:MAG: hypothetical protein F6J95_020370 [Leptolyngbya sp. SIO1E4]|nr:hypothetical protein [Leptolyngbya sp. SIO1E4]